MEPVFKNRVVMLDPARLLEQRDYYYDLMPWLAEWGYNALHWHFTDDEGCVLQFPSHPELESLGHTGCITRLPQYAHLGGAPRTGGGFNSLHPNHPEVRALMRELLTDVAAIFPHEIIHAGLDEVDMSLIPEYSHLTRTEQWQAFGPYAAWIHQEIRQLGRRPAMWGDHLVSAPQLLDQLERDLLIFHWHYWPPFRAAPLRSFLTAGFEVWGAPSSMIWNQKLMPSIREQFQNLREYSAVALGLREAGCTGMVNTLWTPWRYLSGVVDLPLALGGHLFTAAAESTDFTIDFAASFYGFDRDTARDCARILLQLHDLPPQREQFLRLIKGNCNETDFHREDSRHYAHIQREALRLRRELEPLVSRARRHATRLADYLLTAEIIERYGAFGASGRQSGSAGDISNLLQRCDISWRRTKALAWQNVALPYLETEWLLPTLATLPHLPLS